MAPSTPQPPDDSHQQLLDQLDISTTPKVFRSGSWKPSQRRNKNIKQIISENQRREASGLASSQNNSGATTPLSTTGGPTTDGTMTPATTHSNGTSKHPNIAQAAQKLSTLVLEKNLQQRRNQLQHPSSAGPAVTYSNIEAAPSLHPAHARHYCDITGLPSRYTDPKTRLRYHDREVFGVVRTLPPGVAETYLAARGAHVVLK
jgi:INO80 complex subunit C